MKSIIKLFTDGGPFIMSAIILCSIIAVTITLERFFYYKKINIGTDKLLARIAKAISLNHYEEVLTICDSKPTPVTNLVKAGITHRTEGETAIQDAIKDAASLEIPKLEKFLTTLGSIASIAPLLGLLGTVMGNMETFGVIGTGAALGNMEQLAQGISKALLTTAFGLIVAIPTTVVYNHYTNKVNNMILKLEIHANNLIQMLVKQEKRG